jgi:uncharacterized ferritin-like protein (DUF455 family)
MAEFREPPPGSIAAWCLALLRAERLEDKLEPAPPPDPEQPGAFESEPVVRRLAGPGRPPGWVLLHKAEKRPSAGALRRPEPRARLLHTCLHHELQAAELFAWAVLAFPETPREFRAGLLRLATEELEHAGLYRGRLWALGFEFGVFPLRDWFWERARGCRTPLEFVALMGLGFEGGNLEHGARLAAQFRAAGDEPSALVFERIQREEIGHVAFGRLWFERFCGAPLEFEAWRRALPPPLSPALMKGRPLNRAARRLAGLPAEFLDALEAVPSVDGRAPEGG